MMFSVIVPIFNTRLYLPACIQSVLNQTEDDWELLLIDDGSTDESPALIEQYALRDRRIRAFHQNNSGQFPARKKGILEARGDYLLFLDSDDRLDKRCMSVLHETIRKYNPDLILFLAEQIRSDSMRRTLGELPIPAGELPLSRLKSELLSSDTCNSLCTKAFRRELFSGDPDVYSAFYGVHFGEDKAMLLYPLTRAEKAVYCPQPLYSYLFRENSVTHSTSIEQSMSRFSAPMFSLLQEYMIRWGMDDAAHRELLGVYRIRSFLSAYYLARKTHGRLFTHQLRRCAWKTCMTADTLRFARSSALSAKEKIKLLFAWFCL